MSLNTAASSSGTAVVPHLTNGYFHAVFHEGSAFVSHVSLRLWLDGKCHFLDVSFSYNCSKLFFYVYIESIVVISVCI